MLLSDVDDQIIFEWAYQARVKPSHPHPSTPVEQDQLMFRKAVTIPDEADAQSDKIGGSGANLNS